MKNMQKDLKIENFKVEELEPRLEMGKWVTFVKCEEEFPSGKFEGSAGVAYRF